MNDKINMLLKQLDEKRTELRVVEKRLYLLNNIFQKDIYINLLVKKEIDGRRIGDRAGIRIENQKECDFLVGALKQYYSKEKEDIEKDIVDLVKQMQAINID